MNDLIKVNYDKDSPTVSGRELHEVLEIGTKYEDWFPRMCEYGFVENTDYHTLKIENMVSGRTYTKTDHALTIPMAKEICMIQRSDKGKEARQYFLKLEEAWNTPEMVMSRALKMAEKTINRLQSENVEKDKQIETQKPKVVFADAVSVSDTTRRGGEGLTLKELSQLYHLNREIEIDRQQLEELRARAESTSAPLSHTPRSRNTESKLERHVADIVDLQAIISAKQQQCIQERNRLEQFIIGIGDSLTRQIFTLRFINGLDWEDVAAHISNQYGGKYVSNICYRYMRGGEK